MTVEEELNNRNGCRYRLGGVLVAVDGMGPDVPVAHTLWNKDGRLVVVLENGTELLADRCHLRTPWPVACCRPKRRNRWNSTSKKGRV